MNDKEIEKAERLMILFDNIRKMNDTEIVVFLHNLGHYLYDRTKGELYLIEGKDIKRLENLQTRIDKAIEYIENNWIEYSDFQYVDNDDELDIDCESIKELLDILKGSDKNDIRRISIK